MPDLSKVYNAFAADEPLPGDDQSRYVDLSDVRGNSRTALKLVQRVQNAGKNNSYHLIMGHTKCGKTTELNRARHVLEKEGYVTIMFDVADEATRAFEYTTVLLLMAAHIVDGLAQRKQPIRVRGASAKNLAEFLVEREVKVGDQYSAGAEGKIEAKAAPGFLTRLLGEFGLAAQLRGGFQRSREITTKIEANTRRFIEAMQKLVNDAHGQILTAGHKGLVVICDGCDKLELSATDESGTSRDLQTSLFIDHAPDLRSVPCHVIYTVPISIKANLGDVWEQSPEFVPAIPVNQLPNMDDKFSEAGRQALRQVVNLRLAFANTSAAQLMADQNLIERMIDASGGHISDLLLLVREAALEAQTDDTQVINAEHVDRSIRNRSNEYRRLIEDQYLELLVRIDELKSSLNSDFYRDLVFKRLILEYVFGTVTCVDLHPLVAASQAYQGWRNPPR